MQLSSPFWAAATLTSHAIVERMTHRLQARCHAHRVAIRAAGREYLASRNRIPSSIRPFDIAKTGHLICSVRRHLPIATQADVPSDLDWHKRKLASTNADHCAQAVAIRRERRP